MTLIQKLLIVLISALTISTQSLYADQHSKTLPSSRLNSVHSFAFALGDTLEGDIVSRLGKFDLIVVDGEGISAEQVSLLKEQGAIVIGYLSVGTIEKNRSWFNKVKKYRLNLWGDWDEWYADVSRSGFRNVIVKDVAPSIMRKHLDGLFLDNVDMIISHRAQHGGMLTLVKALSSYVHRRKGFLFAQNGDSIISAFYKYLDGWNREDVSFTYNFEKNKYEAVPLSERAQALRTLKKLHDKGLLTLSTDYLDVNQNQKEAIAINRACAVGAIPYVSDIFLTRLPTEALHCP